MPEAGREIVSVYQFAAVILAATGPVLAICGYLKAPASLALFALGFLSGFIPGLPPVAVDPDLALTLFLPPLIYASTVRVSWRLLRFTLVPGVLLGAALVIATVLAVALAARLFLLPGLSWTAALFIGVVASIFDTQLFHEAKGRPHVPRAVSDVLKARELVSRLFILATLALGEEALSSGGITLPSVVLNYLVDIPAGILIGVLVGYAIVWARRRIDPAPVEIAVSIATPYVAVLAAEAVGVSGVAAITTTALVVSAVRIDRLTGATISSAEARISATAFWEEASLMVSSVLFFLAGRALPEAVAALEAWPVWRLAVVAGCLLAIVLAVQFAASFPATVLKPIAVALRRGDGPSRRVATAGIMAWASTRSVIGLVIALSIPATLPDGRPFAERDLILILAAFMVIGSIVVQALSLRQAVTRAALSDKGEEEAEIEHARQAIDRAAEAPGRQHANAHDAARQALIGMRERDEIGDEVLVRMLRETDLHARAAEDNVMPGAGPPNP